MLNTKQLLLCIITALFMSLASPYFWTGAIWLACGIFAFLYPHLDLLKFLSISGFIVLTALLLVIGYVRWLIAKDRNNKQYNSLQDEG